jgi:hypothetical protein
VALELVELDDGGVGVGSEAGEVVGDVEDLLEPPLELEHERTQKHLGCNPPTIIIILTKFKNKYI